MKLSEKKGTVKWKGSRPCTAELSKYWILVSAYFSVKSTVSCLMSEKNEEASVFVSKLFFPKPGASRIPQCPKHQPNGRVGLAGVAHLNIRMLHSALFNHFKKNNHHLTWKIHSVTQA